MEKRFFLDSKIENNKAFLYNDEHRHLSKVMRLKVGDLVECFYENSDIFLCEIEKINKDFTELKVIEAKKIDNDLKTDVTLFQALPKLDKLDFIVEKCCELGVKKIVPFESIFCTAKKNDGKIERLNRIVISALKQCRATSPTKIEKTLTFKEVLEKLKEYDLVLFLSTREADKRLVDALFDIKENPKIAVVVGSEGGFSMDEENLLRSVSNPVTLGKRILRLETAAIVGVGTIIQVLEGKK